MEKGRIPGRGICFLGSSDETEKTMGQVIVEYIRSQYTEEYSYRHRQQ